MNFEDLDWNKHWWERSGGEARLASEEARFLNLRPSWNLIHDPRHSSDVTDVNYQGFSYSPLGKLAECFIWRGEMRLTHGDSGSRIQNFRWTVDLIYPTNYPYGRIQVRVVTPSLNPTRHVFGPCNDLLCYMPYSPNAWTTDTSNVVVLERVRNWFRGYLSRWKHGEQVELPEPLSHVQYGNYDVYLTDLVYRKFGQPSYGTLRLKTKSSPGAVVSGIAITVSLFDIVHRCEFTPEQPFPQSVLEIFFLKGETEQTFEAAWLDLTFELPFVSSPKELFEAISASWPSHKLSFHKWWSEVLFSAIRLNKPVWLFVRFPTPRAGHEWVGYLLWPSQVVYPECPFLSIASGSGVNRDMPSPAKWPVSAGAHLSFQDGRFRSLRLLPARQRDFFRRTEGLTYDASKMHDKHVAVIGCGALGSPAVSLLARSGIGHFTLIDGDTLMHWNLMRHELNLSWVGKAKTEGLEHMVCLINPYATVRRIGYLQSSKQIADAIKDANIVLVAVADDALEENINEVALSLAKPTIYARGLAQMEVGRVHRVLPGQDACFVCLHAHASGYGSLDSDAWVMVDSASQNVVYDEGCGTAAVPGTGVDAIAIGNLLARRALDILLGGVSEDNHWIIVNRGQTRSNDARLLQEGRIQPLYLEPVDGCPSCGAMRKQYLTTISSISSPSSSTPKKRSPENSLPFAQVEIHPTAFDIIQRESCAYGCLETGGVLMGYVNETESKLVVTHATGPGQRAKHGRYTFAKDVRYCQKEVDNCCEENNGLRDYVGEWHRHPGRSTNLSPTDRASLTGIASSSNYHITQPIMLIFGLPDHNRSTEFEVAVHSFMAGHTDTRILPWAFLDPT